MKASGERQWDFISEDIEEKYLASCRQMVSSDEEFKVFRSNSRFGSILEGGSPLTLESNLRRLKKLGGMDWFKEQSDNLFENDKVGMPSRFEVSEIGTVSPSVVQYACQFWEIKCHLGDTRLPNTVLEVGGGYGGLARILSSQWTPKKYILVDLPEVLAVAERYLSNFDIETEFEFISCFDADAQTSIPEIDLFISCSALAELSVQQQERYNSLLLLKSSNFFLIYNTLHEKKGIANLANLSTTWTHFNLETDITVDNGLVVCGRRNSSTKTSIPATKRRMNFTIVSLVPHSLAIRWIRASLRG